MPGQGGKVKHFQAGVWLLEDVHFALACALWLDAYVSNNVGDAMLSLPAHTTKDSLCVSVCSSSLKVQMYTCWLDHSFKKKKKILKKFQSLLYLGGYLVFLGGRGERKVNIWELRIFKILLFLNSP